MKKILMLSTLFVALVFVACDDYVSNIEPLYNQTKETELNKQEYINAFVLGLQNQSAYAFDIISENSGGLSDELLWDMRNTQATFSSFGNTDQGNPQDNEEASTLFREAHELRQLADTLIYRINNNISFTDNALKEKGLFNANLYGGYARYLVASYFGKDQTTGGSPINLSGFIPSAQIYQEAIARLKEATNHTTSAYEKRVANSLIARCYLFLGDYANAATYAQQGMIKNDAPLVAKYNATNDNSWRFEAGETRTQWSVDPRFNAYITAEPTEAARIKIERRTGTGGFVFYRQLKYIMQPDKVTVTPIELIDWQENNLMKAELAVRGAMAGDALALINEIRASRLSSAGVAVKALAAGTTITLNSPVTATSTSIVVERDKELWVRGNRLVDQRRFNAIHIAGMWQYFPISRFEKSRNPRWNQ